MIDHPFLSFKDLTEDELINKTAEVHQRLSRAHMWGSSADLVNQLQWILEMIEEEKTERLKRQNFEAMQGMFPEVVESDPEFKADKTEVVETNVKVVKPAAKPAKNFDAPSFHKEYKNGDQK